MTKEKKAKLFKYGTYVTLIGLYGFIIGPLIGTIITGLVGTVVAVVLGAFLFYFTPTIALSMEMLALKAKKTVISRMPVEALYVALNNHTANLEKMRLKIVEYVAALKVYREKSLEMIKRYPEDREKHELGLKRREDMVAFRVDSYREYKTTVADFEKIVEKAEADWEMAVADAEFADLLGIQEDFEQKLLENTALKAIQQKVAQSEAAMAMSLIDEQVTRQIENKPQHAITYDAGGNIILGNILETVNVREV